MTIRDIRIINGKQIKIPKPAFQKPSSSPKEVNMTKEHAFCPTFFQPSTIVHFFHVFQKQIVVAISH
jgi:hypothetical protein